MSLEKYRRPQLVILHPRSSAREAARAMTDNHIGAVLVIDVHKLVGIVTDGDITLDVVAAEFDPHAATLRDVMSDEIACVDIKDELLDVLETMRKHGCRRVPVLAAGRPVEILTLDDLMSKTRSVLTMRVRSSLRWSFQTFVSASLQTKRSI